MVYTAKDRVEEKSKTLEQTDSKRGQRTKVRGRGERWTVRYCWCRPAENMTLRHRTIGTTKGKKESETDSGMRLGEIGGLPCRVGPPI